MGSKHYDKAHDFITVYMRTSSYDDLAAELKWDVKKCKNYATNLKARGVLLPKNKSYGGGLTTLDIAQLNSHIIKLKKGGVNGKVN